MHVHTRVSSRPESQVKDLAMTHEGHSTATESCEGIQVLLRHFLTVPTECKQRQERLHIGLVTVLPFRVHGHTSSDTGGQVRKASYDGQMAHNRRSTDVPGDLSLRRDDEYTVNYQQVVCLLRSLSYFLIRLLAVRRQLGYSCSLALIASSLAAAPRLHLLQLLCYTPITSASAATPRLHLLQLLHPDCIHFSATAAPRPLLLLC